jgi:hypothetical protein
MKEHLAEPRVRRENPIGHERAVRARLPQMRNERVGPALVDGDRVAINWVFEMTSSDGKNRLLDELARQKWSGDRIVEEQFYHDPAQLKPASQQGRRLAGEPTNERNVEDAQQSQARAHAFRLDGARANPAAGAGRQRGSTVAAPFLARVAGR